MPDRQRFTILLCTYQGERHLPAQLESYLAQTYKAWDLWVSDDGSRDATRALIEAFRAEAGPDRTVRIITGPGQGATRNFLSLLCHPDLPPAPWRCRTRTTSGCRTSSSARQRRCRRRPP